MFHSPRPSQPTAEDDDDDDDDDFGDFYQEVKHVSVLGLSATVSAKYNTAEDDDDFGDFYQEVEKRALVVPEPCGCGHG